MCVCVCGCVYFLLERRTCVCVCVFLYFLPQRRTRQEVVFSRGGIPEAAMTSAQRLDVKMETVCVCVCACACACACESVCVCV